MTVLGDRALRRLRALVAEPGPEESVPAVGSVVADKYEIEARIGAGGMGVVLAARHLELKKRVALKLLKGPSGSAAEARFLREARAAARVDSEHVARVLDVGRLDDGTPFLVMEHLSGTDLARLLREHGPLEAGEAVRFVREACAGVAEAHALGIVHRDLKPSNLFLTARRDGTPLVKVLDFGISKLTRQLEGATESESQLTGASTAIGSVCYMSPEQLARPEDVDARTDIWSLGVVLYELVTGAPPFGGDSAAAVGARIASGEPKRLREAAPKSPAWLEAVVLRCLRKDPSERFADVKALARALEQGREPQKRRGTLAIVVVALLGVLLLATIAATGRHTAGASAPPSSEPEPPRAPIASVSPEAESTSAAMSSGEAASAAEPAKKPAPLPAKHAPALAPSTKSGVDLNDPALLGR